MPLVNDTNMLREALKTARVIAVVGHSDRPYRTSYQIAAYLRRAGYTVYPVNPEHTSINGQPCFPTLADVPEPIDIVNVFRRSEFLAEIVQQAADILAKFVWAQNGVESAEALHIANAAGIPIVMDNCIKVAHQQLMG